MPSMRRTSLLFPAHLMDDLRALSESTGAPVAELVRRACEDYIQREADSTAGRATLTGTVPPAAAK